MTRDRHVALYRRLTSSYPKSFRNEYREDLVTLFGRQLNDEPALRVWLRTFKDLAVTVPTYHLEAKMHIPSNRILTAILSPVAVASTMGVLMMGTGNAAVTMALLIVALISSALALWIWRADQPLRDADSRNSWWKWIAAGAALVAGTFAAMAMPWPDSIDLGDNAYWVVVSSVTAGVALAIVGLVLGIATYVQRQRNPRRQPRTL